MTYKELYDKALWDLEHDKITLGEFENMIEPLKKEIPKEEQTGGDLISRQAVNKININDFVKVKLTDYGKDIFYHQYDNINITYGKEIIKPSYPTVDSDGYTRFQLWYFINLYGRYIDMGLQNVIEPLEIVFESAEKTTEWICIDRDNLYKCSKCWKYINNKYKYCPNCGAKMKGGAE